MKNTVAATRSMGRMRWLALANGADVFTLLGLLLAKLSGAQMMQRGGIWLVWNRQPRSLLARSLRRHPFGSMQAMTLGRVVLAQDKLTLQRYLPHEWQHVRQFMRWGLLFPLLYALEAMQLRLRGKDAYAQNRFELQACAAECRRAPLRH